MNDKPVVESQSVDDADLDFVRSTRKRAIAALMADGVPKDQEDRKFLVQMLDGVSRDALTKKRIKADEKSNNNAVNAVAMVTEFLNRARPRATPVVEVVGKELPVLGAELPRPTLVPGELSEITASETYYEFAERTGLVKSANSATNEDEPRLEDTED